MLGPGGTWTFSEINLQCCRPFEDLPGIKCLDGTSSQHVQQTEKVEACVLPETKLVIVQDVYGHQWGWVETKLSHICVLQKPCQSTMESMQGTSAPALEPTSLFSACHGVRCS